MILITLEIGWRLLAAIIITGALICTVINAQQAGRRD